MKITKVKANVPSKGAPKVIQICPLLPMYNDKQTSKQIYQNLLPNNLTTQRRA